nr:immunoglobulin heavy chain junction region [Mus musculus]
CARPYYYGSSRHFGYW